MNYKYNDNTLLHSVGFNIFKLESIFENGILSFNEAKDKNINYARNYSGYNLNDTISCVRVSYINPNILNSSYHKHIVKDISLIIEDTKFIYNKNERIIHNVDEVLVENSIDKKNIKGLVIPSEYENTPLMELDYLTLDSTSYINIKTNCAFIFEYLRKYNHAIDLSIVNEYLNELFLTNNAIRVNDNKEDYDDLVINFKEVVLELNDYLKKEIHKCFCKLLNKDDVTLIDAVEYLNNKYNKLNIYDIPYKIENIKGK